MHRGTQIKLGAPRGPGGASALPIHQGGVAEEVLNLSYWELFASQMNILHSLGRQQTSDHVTPLVKTF